MVSSTAPALQSSAPLFPYDKWGRALPALARQYRDNYPCPHIRLVDFLKPETASAMADEFPDEIDGHEACKRGVDAVQARE